MPNQDNVGINITANVSGKEQIQQLITQLKEFVTLINSVNGKGASWLGSGPFGGTPRQHLDQLMQGGYAGLGSSANAAMLQDAVGMAQTQARRIGLLQTQDVIHSSAVDALPVGVVMGQSALPGVQAYGPQRYGANWRGSQYSAIPYGLEPMGLPGREAYGPQMPYYTPNWSDISNERALPPPNRYWYGRSRPAPPGTPALPAPGETVGGTAYRSRPTSRLYDALDESNFAQAPSMANNPAMMEQEITQAAKKAGRGNMMLHGLLYQAFFGVMFGGLQDYVQSMQTGKPPVGGSATFAPMIGNFAGMGIGYALGGSAGAMGGGFIGQFAGDLYKGAAQGNIEYNKVMRSYESVYGPSQQMTGWLANLTGVTESNRLATAFGPTALSRGINSEGSKLISSYLGSEERVAFASKLLDNPYTKDIFNEGSVDRYNPTRGPLARFFPDSVEDHYRYKPKGYKASDAASVYLEYGAEGVRQYMDIMKSKRTDVWANVVAPIKSAQDQIMLAQPYMGLGQQYMGLGMNDRGMQMTMQSLNTQIGAMTTMLSKVTGNPAESGKISAGIDSLRLQQLQMLVSPGQMDDRIRQTLNVANTDLAIAQLMPMEFMTGARGLRQTSRNMSPRDIVRHSIQTSQLAIDERHKELARNEDAIRADYNRSGDAEARDFALRNARANFNQEVNPYRIAMAQGYAQLETGWMERLISTTWNSPGRMTGVAKTFNYARASDALYKQGGMRNRFFGGRSILGDNQVGGENVIGGPKYGGPSNFTEAAMASGINVTINVANANLSGGSVSSLKSEIQNTVVNWANRKDAIA